MSDQQPAQGRAHFAKQNSICFVPDWTGWVDKGWIEIFNDEPTARLQRCCQSLQRLFACRHMDKHEARVDQIELTWRGGRRRW